jgi:hypothetical protein
MSYGAQQPKDVEVLEKVMSYYHGKPMKFLEIGIHVGSTARGIKEYCDRHEISLDYWGIDPVIPDPNPPFPGAHFVCGASDESFHLVPLGLDVVLVDGCHCVNHVILDTVHYGFRVLNGGFMLFHDVNPSIQQTMKDPHGPNILEFYNSVLLAHQLIGFPFASWGWRLIFQEWDESAPWGGMAAYRKIV